MIVVHIILKNVWNNEISTLVILCTASEGLRMNNINAAVVATEGSTVSTGSVSVENSHIGNVAYSKEQKEFLSVLEEIEKLVKESGNQDLKDSVDIVKAETQKQKWNKKLMTMGLNAIKGVANGFVVKGLMTLVEKAIVMLGAC